LCEPLSPTNFTGPEKNSTFFQPFHHLAQTYNAKAAKPQPMPLTAEEEKKLVAGCLSNDRRTQELLYKTFYGRFWALCRRYTGDDDETAEVLNLGFLEIFKNIGKYSFQGSLEGWMRTVMVRSVADYFRRSTSYRKHILMEDKDEYVEEDALQNLYEGDLRQMIESLPENARIVFNLYAIDGYTHEEIGKLLSIPSGTSKWYLSEARKRLKTLLKKNITPAASYEAKQ
jgi:RNA polymerase sigma-70 factor (ECF subfamily)